MISASAVVSAGALETACGLLHKVPGVPAWGVCLGSFSGALASDVDIITSAVEA